MAKNGYTERRRSPSHSYRFEHPLFTQIPKELAAPALVACSIAALSANHFLTPLIWFGPIYLLICAFGAWFVGNRFSVMLCFLIATIQVVNGKAMIFQDAQAATILNSALQLSSALAVVLMLGVARQALEIEWRFARLDPLTGALNRKAFFEAAEGDAGQGRMAVIAYADVDGLKRLNDTYGHEAGDIALKEFADRLRKSIRRDDLFARIGGDEFVVFLRVRDGAAARLVAERLNRVLNLEPLNDDRRLKCSLGILFLPTGSKSIDAELKQADTLMYHAKKERAGSIMAMSVKGGLQQLIPNAPATNVTGRQRAAVRLDARHSATSEVDTPSQPRPISTACPSEIHGPTGRSEAVLAGGIAAKYS